MIEPKPPRNERPLHVWVPLEVLVELTRARKKLGYTMKELVTLILQEYLDKSLRK